MTTVIAKMRIISFVQPLFVLTILGILCAIVWGLLEDGKRPDLILKKDDWKCTKHEMHTYLQPMGKSLIPMPAKVCIEYQRKQASSM